MVVASEHTAHRNLAVSPDLQMANGIIDEAHHIYTYTVDVRDAVE